jgi:hypothetical protein
MIGRDVICKLFVDIGAYISFRRFFWLGGFLDRPGGLWPRWFDDFMHIDILFVRYRAAARKNRDPFKP